MTPEATASAPTTAAARPDPPVGMIVVVGFALTALATIGAVMLVDRTTYDTWGGLIVGPVLFLVTLPILARQAGREQSASLFAVLVLALAAKFLGVVARYFVEVVLYGGHADTNLYDKWGMILSQQIRSGNLALHLQSFTGTRFIKLATGIVYAITGPTRLGGYLVFGWLAFLGTFLFYRAFVLAVPSGRPRAYLAYLFFLPSLLFWPSATGKDAWMVFAIGIAAFGAAKMMSGETTRGLIVLAVGLWLGGLVRPHISGIVVAALAGAYLLKRARPEARQLGPILRVASVVAVVVVAVVFVRRGQEYLSGHGINTGEGLVGALQQAGAQTTRGTSQFSPHIITGPTQLLPGTVTVLYRPFPTEADNRLALVAALEGVFLAVVTAWRWRWIVSAIRSGRRQPYIMFAFLTAGLLIVALSSIGNFGLLVRERSQMLPFFLVLLSVPPPAPNSEVAVPARPNRAVVAMMQRSEISS